MTTEESDFLDVCDDALDVLGGLTTGNDLEKALKEALRLKAESLLGNTFSGGDETSISDMHDLCPWQGGYALGLDYGLFAESTDSLPGHNIYECVAPDPLIRPAYHYTPIQEDLTVYPNPASDNITIDSKATLMEVSFYDITCKLLKRYYPNTNSFQLNVDDLSPGVYLLNVNLSDGIHPVKIVINP